MTKRDRQLRKVATQFVFERLPQDCPEALEAFGKIPYTGSNSPESIQRDIQTGLIDLIEIKADDETAAYIGCRLFQENTEDADGGKRVFELNFAATVVAKGGIEILSLIEAFARNNGAQLIRGFTVRPAILKHAFSRGYVASEITFEKEL